MTVFIVQHPKPNKMGWMPDLSSASAYGKLVYVFDSHEKIYALPSPSLLKARRTFAGFDFREDYFLWPGLGDPMGFVVCYQAVAELAPDYVKFLYWDRRRSPDGNREFGNGYYVPITLPLKGVQHAGSEF